MTSTTSLGLANGTLSTASSLSLLQGKARGCLSGNKDRYSPIKISWLIWYISSGVLRSLRRWSRRHWSGLPLESATCYGALLTVVDNHHLQLILAVILSRDLVTTYPCPVITSRRAGPEGYNGVNQLQVVVPGRGGDGHHDDHQEGLRSLQHKTSIVLRGSPELMILVTIMTADRTSARNSCLSWSSPDSG